ncbi:carbonate dehydratase [Dyadobacter frigoris]|uniref:Carbonic anhydrase n=1 Tax=Dyadobacter frigoris TaxID=2576211 RepID=A0A4U6D4E4_9BACT|nr:carbonate dehydratase [Dyadobacter frigoris]TKT92122.1 carbonate dehydratase [Dyadobacter frigoris]GLU52990.1 carbonic anhydrase [Dyadobacter frigoris]
MELYQRLLQANKDWAIEKLKLDENYFDRLSADQKPDFLWIGCSDSRVPAEELTGSRPGDMFVHRNVANLVVSTDMNMLSVLQYAVEVLKVRHILVVGHYGCGGVKAAMTHQDLGLINKWLRNIKDVYQKYAAELDAIEDETARVNRLVELNVVEQVNNLLKTTIVQKAWNHGQKLHLHGWVFGLNDGIIKPIVDMPAGTEIADIYRYDFE